MWIDLTWSLNENLPSWPGVNKIQIKQECNSNKITTSDIFLHLHYGTHIDAPLHCIPQGRTVNTNINSLCGKVQIIEAPDIITPEIVQNINSKIVFFKTMQNKPKNFNPDYSFITPQAAKKLVQEGIKIVGTDCWSVEKFDDTDFNTHKILLSNDVIIIEFIKLYQTSPGTYETMIIPLPIQAEASPARVLIKSL